ncbi:flagellar brake protein [Methylomonas rosea]|uniref:Flagellar brake protein n=1 Tax=Methylomonas rosea TaxID=2952227 RepID=A0ABT1TP14_9GAMM|nr:flagellar brake protein [Methylomonas sp. WSC-7]MCQ8116514.1 flagellar brake protein [Methylomonas sp. WSC-7]
MENDYAIFTQKQIVNYLTEIQQRNCILSARYGADNQAFLTAIVQIDPKRNILAIDVAPKQELTDRLLLSDRVHFSTQVDGIEAAFHGVNIKLAQGKHGAVLTMPLPDRLHWRQRRNYYRVKVPQSHVGTYCQFGFNMTDANGEQISLVKIFKLMDIGLCGLALCNPDHDLQQNLASVEADSCTLFLHDQEHHHADVGLRAKYSIDVKTSTISTAHRIGFQFTAISPAFESSVQIYMQSIERMLKNIDSH